LEFRLLVVLPSTAFGAPRFPSRRRERLRDFGEAPRAIRPFARSFDFDISTPFHIPASKTGNASKIFRRDKKRFSTRTQTFGGGRRSLSVATLRRRKRRDRGTSAARSVFRVVETPSNLFASSIGTRRFLRL